MSVLANYPMFTINGHGSVEVDLLEVPTSPNNCVYNNPKQSLIKKLPDNVHLWFLVPINCIAKQAPTLFEKKNILNNPYAKRIAKSHGGIPRVVTPREILNNQTTQTKRVPNQTYHNENSIKIRRGGGAAYTIDPTILKTHANSAKRKENTKQTLASTGQNIIIKTPHSAGTYKYNSSDPIRLMLEIKKSLSTANSTGSVGLHPMLEYAEFCPPGSYYTDHIVTNEGPTDVLRAGIYGHLDYGSRSPKLYFDAGFKKLKKENIAATSHTYTVPTPNSYVKQTIDNTNTDYRYLLSDIIDHIVRLMKNPNEPIIVIFKVCRSIKALRIKSDKSVNYRHIHSKPKNNKTPQHIFTGTNTLKTFNTKIPNINNLTHHFRPGSKSHFQANFLTKIHEHARYRLYNKLRCIEMVSKYNAEQKSVYLTQYNIYRHINRVSARGKYFSTEPNKIFYNSPNQYFSLPSYNGSIVLSETDPFSNTLIRNAAQKKAAKTIMAVAKPRYSTKVRQKQVKEQQKNKRERSRTKPNNNEPLSRSNQHLIPIKQLKNIPQSRKSKTTK